MGVSTFYKNPSIQIGLMPFEYVLRYFLLMQMRIHVGLQLDLPLGYHLGLIEAELYFPM